MRDREFSISHLQARKGLRRRVTPPSAPLHMLQPLDRARLEAGLRGILFGGLRRLGLADFPVRFLLALGHVRSNQGRKAPHPA